MKNGISELRRRANSRRDIEGQTDLTTNRHGRLPWTLNSDFSPVNSFICQVAEICRLIDTYKRRVFGLFFLVLETGAAVLDGIGKGKLHLLLAAFLLSTIGFFITLRAYVKRRTRSTSTIEVTAVSQLRVVELVFSSIQLIASLLQLLLAHLKEEQILDVRNNIEASVFPLAFAMVAVAFIFKNDEAITNSSQEDFQHQVEHELIGNLARKQDGPSISLDIMPESRNQDGPSISSDIMPESFFDMDNYLAIDSPQRDMHLVEDSPALTNFDESSSSTLIEPNPVEFLSENQVNPDNYQVIDSPQRDMHLVEDSLALTNSDESSSSTLIEPNPSEFLSENQVNPVSSLHMRTDVTSKMTPATLENSEVDFLFSFLNSEDNYLPTDFLQGDMHLVEDFPALTNFDEFSSSTLIEPNPFEFLSENQVNLVSFFHMRMNFTSKMTPAAPEINEVDFLLSFEDNYLVIDSPQRDMHLVEDSLAFTNSDESSSSTLIELNAVEFLSENQINIVSSLHMRTDVTSKMAPAALENSEVDFLFSLLNSEVTEQDMEDIYEPPSGADPPLGQGEHVAPLIFLKY